MKKYCYSFVLMVLASPLFSQTWQKITSMPGGARDGGIIFSIGNKIYSGGGGDYVTQKDFYEYDLGTKKWTKKANIPSDSNRGFAAGFSIGNKGYVGMGSSGIFAPSVKSDLWEYDTAANTWTRKADYPGGNRDGIGVFVIGNKAYVGGGLDSLFNGDAGFYEYDPSNNTWTQKADLPVAPLIFQSTFTIGNYGYMACGGVGLSGSTDLWRYDPTKDEWDQLSSFPGAKRQACAAFVLNGKGYVGLGQDNYSVVYKDFYSYDPAKDSWKKEADFGGTARAWPVSITVGDTAYIGDGANFAGGGVNPFSDWWTFTNATASIISNKDNSEIVCYPQPAFSTISLAGLSKDKTYSIQVFDALGRNVASREVNASDPRLGISNFSNGLYNLHIHDTQGKIISLQFIKE